ncbi:sugar transferase [Aliiroseovarius sp. PTFE2010]|uniref:sugar transferase n=1 Tax=Aliiroseovarius sp. PTFE2010 TaxID=3417190 RepID=UPI003CF66068
MKSFDPLQTQAYPIGGRRKLAGNGYVKVGKRVADIVLALLALPFVTPVIAVFWALTRRDGAPGFFGHVRVGRNGKAFRCWKIRTMVPDAQARLAIHLATNPAAAAEWERDFKLRNDPRVTGLGAFLRRTSLDELPQIWNVLRGEMSFVGPRPVVEDELSRYGANRWAYLSMKPGITGLWQVSGRNDVSYDERISMDISYMQRCSPFFDLWLIVRTAGAILGATGR